MASARGVSDNVWYTYSVWINSGATIVPSKGLLMEPRVRIGAVSRATSVATASPPHPEFQEIFNVITSSLVGIHFSEGFVGPKETKTANIWNQV